MIRLAIVGCSSSKHHPSEWGKAHPDHGPDEDVEELPLEHLYKGSYWTVKRRYAREVAAEWRILSAKLGLAFPDREMTGTYDRTITDMTDEEIEAWANDVEPALRRFASPYEDTEAVIDVLLGQRYIEPIEDVLEDLPVEIAYPFEETEGIGEQMAVLNELVEERSH